MLSEEENSAKDTFDHANVTETRQSPVLWIFDPIFLNSIGLFFSRSRDISRDFSVN